MVKNQYQQKEKRSMNKYCGALCSFILIVCSIGISPLLSQEMLSLRQAIHIALEQNRNRKSAINDVLIAQRNFTLGNAGFLPTLNLLSEYTRSINNTQQQYFDGRSINRDAAASNTVNLGLRADWTIFNGLSHFASHKILGTQVALSQAQEKATTEELIAQLSTLYYEMLQQQEILRVLQTTIEISQQRLTIAQEKYEVGTASKVELLQAHVDLNADRAALLQQQQRLFEMKTQFNLLLGRDPATPFQIADSITITPLSRERILEEALHNSPYLLTAQYEQELAQLHQESLRSEFLPTLSLFAGYATSRSESQAGFISSNQNSGWNYGISLSYNLFNGLNSSRKYAIAQLQLSNAQLQRQQREEEIKSGILLYYEQYRTAQQLIALEEQNLKIAEENLNIALERYRIGVITSVEFREAQRSYIEAENRLIRAKYQAKTAEIQLRKLAGLLTSEFLE